MKTRQTVANLNAAANITYAHAAQGGGHNTGVRVTTGGVTMEATMLNTGKWHVRVLCNGSATVREHDCLRSAITACVVLHAIKLDSSAQPNNNTTSGDEPCSRLFGRLRFSPLLQRVFSLTTDTNPTSEVQGEELGIGGD
jgi:hypothetical protein